MSDGMKFTNKNNNGGGSGACCRFKWHPYLLTLLIMASLGLSIFSSLDCHYLSIDLGFIPQNYRTNSNLGFGLWSYSAPGGRCLSYSESREAGGVFTEGDTTYTSLIMNDDINWSMARIFAIVGVLFGAIALLSIIYNLCKKEPHLVDIITYTTITAFLSECSKFGLFLGTDICQSQEYWYNDKSDELIGSKTCQIGMGAYMSIGSFAAYFISVILAVGFATRPKSSAEYDYEDEGSLPSWMNNGDDDEQNRRGTNNIPPSRHTSDVDDNNEQHHQPNNARRYNQSLTQSNRSGNFNQSIQSDVFKQSFVSQGRDYNQSLVSQGDNFHQSTQSNNFGQSFVSNNGYNQSQRSFDTRNLQPTRRQQQSSLQRSFGSSSPQRRVEPNSQRIQSSLQRSYQSQNSRNSRGSDHGRGSDQDRHSSDHERSNQRLFENSYSRIHDPRGVNVEDYGIGEMDEMQEMQQIHDDDGVNDLPVFQGYNNPPPQDDEVSEMTWDMAY